MAEIGSSFEASPAAAPPQPEIRWWRLRWHVEELSGRVDALEESVEPEPWVELRIHGVSGTPPEDLLCVPNVVQVAGDSTRRVFQRAGADNEPLGRDADGRLLEGYHWGNLTSGSWRQAFWLLLIPFGLINASQFMLPYPPERDEGVEGFHGRRLVRGVATFLHIACSALLRLVGLGMTCVLALTLNFILLVLFGSKFLRGGNLPGWVFTGGGAAIGLGATALGVFLLYWAGGRTHPFAIRTSQRVGFEAVSGLARWGFLKGDPSAPDLRRLHLAAALSIAAVPSALALERYSEGLLGLDYSTWAKWLLLAVGIAVVFIGDPGGGESDRLPDRIARLRTALRRRPLGGLGDRVAQGRDYLALAWLVWVRVIRSLARACSLPILGLAGLLLVLEIAALIKRTLPPGVLYGEELSTRIDTIAFWLLALMTPAMAGLLVLNALLALATHDRSPIDARRYFGRYAGGLAGSLVSMVGVFFGLGFCGAVSFASAKAMGLDNDTFPQILQRIAYSWGLTAILIVCIMLVLMANRVLFCSPRGLFRSRARLDFQAPGRSGLSIPPDWEPKVASAMWSARAKRALTWIVIVFAGAGIVMSVASGQEAICADGEQAQIEGFDGLRDWLCDSQVPVPGWVSGTNTDTAAPFLKGLGSTTLLAFGAGLVIVGRGALGEKSKRRGANVLWDVIAFWPHAAHPYAPPPYSQLAVLHFRDRIRWHLYGQQEPPPLEQPDNQGGYLRNLFGWVLRRAAAAVAAVESGAPAVAPPGPSGRVVVAAHSQGSLIAVTALLWLPQAERDRVSFVTFGSQLQVAFPRAFPHYVNHTFLTELNAEFGPRWVNLYRETDAIAGPVLSWRHW